MIRSYRTVAPFLIILILLVATGSPAVAQEIEASVFIADECSGMDAVLTVDMNVWGTIPEHIVGWIIERRVLGKCVPHVQVGGVRPFEPGENQYVVVDTPEEVGYSCLYYAQAVDAEGNRYFIYWPQRTIWAYYDCQGSPAARGLVTEGYGYPHLDVCPDDCWYGMSYFDPSVPAEGEELIGQYIDVYGELMAGMEGPYINITGWAPSPNECGPVPTRQTTWGALKSSYR